jgi:hypothetical protein
VQQFSEPALEGVRPAKVKHLAEEAQSLHATNLWDFSAEKRLALLVCLIHSAQILTRDEILHQPGCVVSWPLLIQEHQCRSEP